MKYDKFRKGIVSLALAGAFLLGGGAVNTAFAANHAENGFTKNTYESYQYPHGYRDRDRRYWEQRREREARMRYRRMERERELRYRYGADRRGGYYDRWGRFHRY
jgi:hypothetical protein